MIQTIHKKTPGNVIIYLICSFIYLQIHFLMPDDRNLLFASDETSCADRLDQAEEHYYDGEFDQTIKIVNECLKQQTLLKDEQIRSYIILARTYLAKKDTVRTKDNIRIVLKLDSNYQPTIEQETPKYVNMVAAVRKEQEVLSATQSASGINKWWYIGAGGVAAVAIIAIVASGSGGDEGNTNGSNSLPNPPDFPD